jgi:UDP-sulfoquinovose synthase
MTETCQRQIWAAGRRTIMKILILGGDGYLGWATAMHLSARGHDVVVVDNYMRRNICRLINVEPLVSIPYLKERAEIWQAATGYEIQVSVGDVTDYEFLSKLIHSNSPEGIVHYAEQPSAPYSMMGHSQAIQTINNNMMTTINTVFAVRDFASDCQIVKLGTMGEYGTPNIDIEEGYLEVLHRGRKQTFLYPKQPGSIYHLSKVNDSDLLYFAARTWRLAITDLNQGPVYGIETDELTADAQLAPIFNYDSVFGTIVNRFVVQAINGFPLTVYGRGGQTRGYLNIRDTLQCVELALTNRTANGDFRVLNQFVETFSANSLAEKVREAGRLISLKVTVQNMENPRKELEEHYYNPKNTGIHELGLKPNYLTNEILVGMLTYVKRFQNNINSSYFLPTVHW